MGIAGALDSRLGIPYRKRDGREDCAPDYDGLPAIYHPSRSAFHRHGRHTD